MPDTRPPSAGRRRMSGRQRAGQTAWALVRLLFWLPLWLVALLLLVLGLALAPFGTGFLLSQAEKHELIRVEHHEGGLLDEFRLQGFAMDALGVHARVDEFELAWADDCLLSGRLCLDILRVVGADIRLDPSEKEAPASEPEDDAPAGEIILPFPVELRRLVLDDVSVQLGNGTRLGWAHFDSALTAEGGQIEVAPSRLQKPRLYLPPSPGVRLTQSVDTPLYAEGIDAAIAVQTLPEAPTEAADASVPLDEALAARKPLELPAIRLPVNVNLELLEVEDFVVSGVTDYTVNELRLGFEGDGDRITLTRFNLVTPDASARLDANTTLSNAYPLSARLHLVLFLPELMPELSGEELTLELSGALDDLHAELNASGTVNARLSASADLLAPAIPFELRLQSEALQWPLPPRDAAALAESTAVNAGAAVEAAPAPAPEPPAKAEEDVRPYHLRALDLAASGSLEGYRATLSFQAEGPEVPKTDVALAGSGDITRFAWDSLDVDTGDGRLSSQGQVEWQAPFRVDATLALDDFDPHRFVDALEGRLSGNAEFSLRQLDDQWAVDVPRLNIDGTLQGYPLMLDAALEANSNLNLNIRRLDFAQGDNRLNARGRVSESDIDLDADIDLRELDSISAELGGTLTGDITARGSFTAPEVTAKLNGDALRFADNTLRRLRLDADVRGIDDPALDVGLELAGVDAGGQALESVMLDLDGKLSRHRLTLEARGGADNDTLSRARLALSGGLDQARSRYQGTLSTLEADSSAGDVRLESPVDIRYALSRGELELTPFCLRREQGGVVCSQKPLTASAQQGEASLSLREVPMDAAEPFLPEGWQLDGDTTADLTASWSAGGARWQADGQLASRLSITALNDYGQPVELPQLSLDADLDADTARAGADITLSLAEAGDARLQVAVDDPLGAGTLDGALTINGVTLEPYRPLVVGMDELAGTLHGQVNIGGSTRQPDLQGALELTGINASGPDIPVSVPDGEVNVSFNGERGSIDGFLNAERGRLDIDGDAVWPSGDAWRVSVNLNAASPLLVTLPAFGRLEASPDIRIRATPEQLQVRGDVSVPWARLEVGEIPRSATAPSADEVIITEREDKEAERAARQRRRNPDAPSAADELESAGMAMDVHLTVTLGGDMEISAYGLESGLAGSLEVRQDSGGLQLFGDVNLEDGRFKAFGQDLLIRRGKIYFSGPPGLPSLDFEAIRNPEVTEDDVIAGVRVTGIAAEPNIAIFSEPAMDETRALSYLLRGRAPDASGGGLDSALTTALIGMSLGRAGGAVGSVGEAFGIEDLTLDTTGAGDDSQVAVSGQLSDRLRVSYGVGIFSPIAELTLRYTLWRDLYLQAVSGTSQAVDLIYQFSRKGNPRVLEDDN
ncbi:autotransporter assembly complex protein TamB [Halomonas garicola]|uniref:autotransporter assembly complex protein TamB n=1 Tax=Halomonas garicola TaxID=1690008 RepID=UPI00289A9A2D|nr:translocation/assembly module TamB domain-containing protein [Halomonas garicola]